MVRALTLLAAGVLAAAPVAAQTFAIDPASSTTAIEVGKAGLFSFAAGHVHEVRGPIESGAVQLDARDPSRNRVELVIAAGALQVTGKGEPANDVPKVQAAMQGEKVLDVARYPRITFKSTTVKGVRDAASFDATVTGTLTIRDRSQPVTATVRVQKSSSSLTATGRFAIKQTAFGIQPVSVAGVVAVKDELQISFSISSKAQQGPE
ncbi:MAG TPA: YceI family protein [Vicinamibacterales bacterium]|jgi:polyisoprenoid-binding protein YceI|nr:YceI family protein [Vicinamibacterales bacterium]